MGQQKKQSNYIYNKSLIYWDNRKVGLQIKVMQYLIFRLY